MNDYLIKIFHAAIFYFSIIGIFRVFGKRHSGQVTTFDLVILISIAVAIQQECQHKGVTNVILFIVVVSGLHFLGTYLGNRFPKLRDLVRGSPSELVRSGAFIEENLKKEGVTKEDVQAGMRKAGIKEISDVEIATLEETGQISVVKKDDFALTRT